MDRIIVKANTDMERVIDWSNKLKGMAVLLPFPEAEIEFQEEQLVLNYRDLGSPNVAFDLFVDKGSDRMKIVSWESNMEDGSISSLKINTQDATRKGALAMILMNDNTISKCVLKFKALMLFAAYYKEEIVKTRVITRTSAAGSKKKSKKQNRKPLTVRKYVFSNEMMNELPNPKKEWSGYRNSFTVRGHYRKVGENKVIWVRPYIKKGITETKSDREYVL